jgi:hypothetical protein
MFGGQILPPVPVAHACCAAAAAADGICYTKADTDKRFGGHVLLLLVDAVLLLVSAHIYLY